MENLFCNKSNLRYDIYGSVSGYQLILIISGDSEASGVEFCYSHFTLDNVNRQSCNGTSMDECLLRVISIT